MTDLYLLTLTGVPPLDVAAGFDTYDADDSEIVVDAAGNPHAVAETVARLQVRGVGVHAVRQLSVEEAAARRRQRAARVAAALTDTIHRDGQDQR